MRRLYWLAAVLLLITLPACAGADTAMYIFTEAAVPDVLRQSVYSVAEGNVDVTMTFAGDCTLGGEYDGSAKRFAEFVDKNGMAYPFEKLQFLFASDDFTVVNLEGVLTNDHQKKVKKKYNFLGPTAYTEILTSGSVECANLANNHSGDYGERGLNDTIGALNAAQICWFDDEHLCVLEKNGVRIGMTAMVFRLTDEKRERLARQAALLRQLGCAAIVLNMHGGIEYSKYADYFQQKAVQTGVKSGVSLIVGHHPHVLQGVDVIENVPVVYSLGNCCFGGNVRPKDYDAALLRAVFHFENGLYTSLDWSIYPVSISGTRPGNDFQPTPVYGADALTVMKKLQDRSETYTLAPFSDGEGAKQRTVYVQNP